MKIKIELTQEETRGLASFANKSFKKSHKRVKAPYGKGEYRIETDKDSILEFDINSTFLMSYIAICKTLATGIMSFIETWFSSSSVKVEDLTEEENKKKEEQEVNEEKEPVLQRDPLKGCKEILDEIQNNNKEE